MQQLSDGVAVVRAEIGKMLVCARLENILEHLILAALAVSQVFQPARQLEAHGVEKYLARTLVRKQLIRPLHVRAVLTHERLIKKRSRHDRNIGRDNVIACVQLVHLREHLGTLTGERNDDHNVLAKLRRRVRQLAHRKAVKQIAARKFIAREHPARADAEAVELREYLIRAVAHAVKHDGARLFLQPAPDRLLQC